MRNQMYRTQEHAEENRALAIANVKRVGDNMLGKYPKMADKIAARQNLMVEKLFAETDYKILWALCDATIMEICNHYEI